MLAARFVAARHATATVSSDLSLAGPDAIATHDGTFHCDEALACGLLQFVPEYHGKSIIRTRQPDAIARSFAAIDVGSEYDEGRRRFDHHQKEFTGTMTTGKKIYGTRLSSAGLVYKHFGRSIIQQFCAHAEESGLPVPNMGSHLEVVYDRLYKSFVEHVDGIDNGVEEFSGERLTRNYDVTTTLSSRVGRLNPQWNQPSTPDFSNQQFIKAMTLTTTEFFEALEGIVCSWLPARSVVEQAFQTASTVHPSGAIILLSSGGCPWKDHLLELEKEAGAEGRTLYVLYPDIKNGYRVQCVPKDNSSFANRKSLPWQGLRDDALSEASGIPGGIFVHATGFIGGNSTKEGAVAMAIKALEA